MLDCLLLLGEQLALRIPLGPYFVSLDVLGALYRIPAKLIASPLFSFWPVSAVGQPFRLGMMFPIITRGINCMPIFINFFIKL
jgi:hypothetical protein